MGKIRNLATVFTVVLIFCFFSQVSLFGQENADKEKEIVEPPLIYSLIIGKVISFDFKETYDSKATRFSYTISGYSRKDNGTGEEYHFYVPGLIFKEAKVVYITYIANSGSQFWTINIIKDDGRIMDYPIEVLGIY